MCFLFLTILFEFFYAEKHFFVQSHVYFVAEIRNSHILLHLYPPGSPHSDRTDSDGPLGGDDTKQEEGI